MKLVWFAISWLACILTLAVPAIAAEGADPPAGETAGEPETTTDAEPQDLGIVERAQRGLVQLDVSVRGPWEAISDLGPDDFLLSVNGKPIERLIVDRVCSRPPQSKKSGKPVVADEPADGAPRPRASFMFYFDQRMLTALGRQNSIDIVRRLIPDLVRDGGRGVIVSSGKKLETLVDLTDDTVELLAALDRLEGDHDHWIT
jgi:hypothetical protein